jgi:hypothetical protein
MKNGTAIPGATAMTFSISASSAGDNGKHLVVITNAVRSVNSNEVTVIVAPAVPTGLIAQAASSTSIELIWNAAPDENFHCFLLFGQSNKAGGCKEPNPGDCDLNERVKVLSCINCQGISPACSQIPMNRTKNQWHTAAPPYHDCDEGIGIADNFAKTLLDGMSSEISIGLIPCALSGMYLTRSRTSGRCSRFIGF